MLDIGRCKTEESNDVGGVGGEDGEDDDEGIQGPLEDEEKEFGKRRHIKKQDPKEPTPQERAEHDLTHLPFRSWCRHCIRGRGREEDCRRSERAPDLPEIHIDFMFMGEEGGKGTIAMLVARERGSRAVMCCVAPRKSSGEFLARRIMAFMREVGCELEAMTMKSDNEPALLAVIEGVQRLSNH